STCKISGCLSYRILDSGPDGTQTTLTDPVIQCIKEQGLDLSFGGTKENNNYPLMQMCVDTYFAQRKPLQALTLLHNYAWIMSSETTAFQERYDFNIDEWRAKFRQLCLEYFGDSRTQFT
nr:hypothetical protein [Escherichia coli]